MKLLADALEAHKLRMHKLAAGPIFQAGNGKSLNLENVVNRVIKPALTRCALCQKREDEHKPEGHLFERDKSLPQWHGWHAFRRGLATNLSRAVDHGDDVMNYDPSSDPLLYKGVSPSFEAAPLLQNRFCVLRHVAYAATFSQFSNF